MNLWRRRSGDPDVELSESKVYCMFDGFLKEANSTYIQNEAGGMVDQCHRR